MQGDIGRPALCEPREVGVELLLISLYLPYTPPTSPLHLPTSPHNSPHLPTSPRISPHLQVGVKLAHALLPTLDPLSAGGGAPSPDEPPVAPIFTRPRVAAGLLPGELHDLNITPTLARTRARTLARTLARTPSPNPNPNPNPNP